MVLALGVSAAATTWAGESISRATPQRPARAAAGGAVAWQIAGKTLNGVDYVDLASVAEALGLKWAWNAAGSRVVLSGEGAEAELAPNARETVINGMRVFLGQPVLSGHGKLFVSRTDFEKNLAPLLRPGAGVARLARPRVIVLDPGHGGRDHGTSTYEKTYALDVARRAKPLLEAAGFRVVLTRTEDAFVSLPERAVIANTSHADVFVSIHFNALPKDTKTSGLEIFTFAPVGQRSTDSWSPGKADDREDEASPGNRCDYWNSVLAHALQNRMSKDLKTFDRGKKQAHWSVLRPLHCPGVLVECGFLTSATEAKKIGTEAYRQRLAETLVAGLVDYAATVAPARR
ncbi:N-acetylmuramoyl-L-alanine amidase [Horticoccus luteus]|uniref:N-acetylmuramoyl-L-alanine amidase n=1 Tax=Horticoccus luteus TaxID=2862869 RepID=A0A8F9TWJ2_9BACT|nr:N-acetylmuramoyl-L-alanine amidase [Horticoccus luteus]QYM79068.1 N-acetylmuramoyl-L-alanine amidase [Horticoccus luteus]